MALGGETGRVPSDVTLDNWQSAEHLHWTFEHVADILPTALIARGTQPVAELPAEPTELSDIPLYDKTNGRRTTVGDVMAATATDSWIVTHRGKVLAEQYNGGMTADSSHLLMSVSKSLIGTVAGAARQQWRAGRRCTTDGRTMRRPSPTRGMPARTVRHLLDMRSGIAFSEDDPNPMAEVRLLEQAIGWAPRTVPDLPTTMYDFFVLRCNRPGRMVDSSITGPARRTCSAGSARRPAGFACPSPDVAADVEQARRAERRHHRSRPGRHGHVRRRYQRLLARSH